MSYKIQEVEGIGPSFATKLASAKIATTNDLLKLCCDKKGRKAVATQTGVDESKLLKWANMADLMRISGIGKQYAELLEAAGVDTVKELRTRNAENLADKMKEINAAKKLTRGTVSSDMVNKWIDQANSMNALITH